MRWDFCNYRPSLILAKALSLFWLLVCYPSCTAGDGVWIVFWAWLEWICTVYKDLLISLMHKSFTKWECFSYLKHKLNITHAHGCLGVASSFPRGGKIFIQPFEVNCYWNAEPLRRSATDLILLFLLLFLTLVGRAVQEPKHWCLELFKVLYGIFPTSSCFSRSAQSLMCFVMYLPALLQVSWILRDVKYGTWCLCLGSESVPM